MGTRVTVGPDVKLGSHDIKLFSETEAWGLRLQGGAGGLKEIPATPQTSLFAKTGQKHGDFEYGFTHLEQRTWEGGRGLLDASEDQTKFLDSRDLWSVTPGKVAPAPYAALAEFPGYFEQTSADRTPLDTNSTGTVPSSFYWPFTTGAEITPVRISFWAKRTGLASANHPGTGNRARELVPGDGRPGPLQK